MKFAEALRNECHDRWAGMPCRTCVICVAAALLEKFLDEQSKAKGDEKR